MRLYVISALTLATLAAAAGCSSPDNAPADGVPGGAADGAAEASPVPAEAGGIAAEYFHGDWCERYTPPHDPDDPVPTEDTGEETVNLTFDPDGTFRIGRSAASVRAQGRWEVDDGQLRMPGNSVASRVTPELVSAAEFRFRSLGADFRVTRGHCDAGAPRT